MNGQNLNARGKLRRGQGTSNTSGAFDQPVNILSGMERGAISRNNVRGPQACLHSIAHKYIAQHSEAGSHRRQPRGALRYGPHLHKTQ